MTWQAAAARGQLSAMGIPQASEQAAALQMQLMQQQMAAAAIAQQQHQQQQQQNEVAMASLQQALAASQGMPAVIPFMQPFPLATPGELREGGREEGGREGICDEIISCMMFFI